MIQITSEAPRSQSHQTNNNLILSNKAHVDSIPGMEILTNDVQCKHGATVGKIDQSNFFTWRAVALIQQRGNSF